MPLARRLKNHISFDYITLGYKMKKTPEWAYKRIQKSIEKKSKELDLTFLVTEPNTERLTEIPELIFQLNHIELLNFAGNQISYIPDEIEKLINLKILRLPSNNLQTITEKLARLTRLSFLDLDNNPLKNIPSIIFELHNLQALSIDDNFIENIPDEISRLEKLEILSLERNLITDIPSAIFRLTSLKKLSFANTVNLYGYTQSQNNNKNKITTIPSKILQLSNLVEFNLDENAIESPPPEIVNIQGYGLADIQRIHSYFQNIEVEGIDHLYEAKLLIIGEGGAGKTTLAKKILNPEYQLQEQEETTKGVDISQWHFSMDNGKPFKVNIWDFGGQEIYHSTHRYFLTNRSLYLLIADTRKDDTDFYYWLNIIELLGGDSPLLIIKNEKQDRHREFPESQFRSQFSSFKGTIAVNLASNRGLDEVYDEIKHYVKRLPHIGNPLPKSWVKVRMELENDERDFISLSEYLNICEQNGFRRLEDKLQLSGYLHDLGVCLHFQEDDLLRKIVILKPRWGTEAAYLVLDNLKIIKNYGVFNRQDLRNIWNKPQYAEMLSELLQLMLNFKLCYQIPTKLGVFVAPQLLSEQHPSYKWNEKANIRLRFAYEFMPKGILSQFIVVMNSHIVGQSLVWKSGVVLEHLIDTEKQDDNTRVEVIEYYDKRELHIRISGNYTHEALSIVNYELDKIHESYKKLKYKKLLACFCPVCKKSKEPNFYPLDVLRRFALDKQPIQCQVSYHMIDPSNLLASVDWSGVTKVDDETYLKKSIIPAINLVVKEMNMGNKIDIKMGNVSNTNGQLFIGKFNEVIANLDSSGQKEFAEALKALKEAVMQSQHIPYDKKEEHIEVINQIGEEAAKNEPNKTLLKIMGDGLLLILKAVPDVAKAVAAVAPFLPQ